MTWEPQRPVYRSELPFEASRIQAAAVYCSDGRFGEHIDDFLHNALRLPRYDRLSIPGGAACLAGHFPSFREEYALMAQLRFLLTVHELRRVVLIAHRDCAYYAEGLHVRAERQFQQQVDDLVQAAHRIRSLSSGLEVDAYFASRTEEGVDFHVVGEVD